MVLDRADRIAGIPASNVQNALRDMPTFEGGDIAAALRIGNYAAAALVVELQRRGLCRPSGRGVEYELTCEGGQFVNALVVRPISRQRANELIEAVVERANAFVARYPAWPIRLTRLAVSGSFVSDDATLSGLDIGVEIEKELGPEFASALNAARTQAEGEGFKPRSKYERVVLPERFIYFKLKAGERGVSLHAWDDLSRLNCPHRVIWSDPSTGNR